ncbi:hypothetical protein AURDEDRAFT_116105 [Auricularia subglabra TFB-10046 SS5]|uniref:Uncharacterized protein n=1 Tax=Auricularia subglabra (strain TFB-10046 / SS5) TaxID=717982 RepID=J0LIW7_AURST|nr:hypothetical protein AURDEDRAFT_116105 [Auricularia subglabra TFB-10046 SS5]
MSAALAPYNVSLAATSPLFSYTPSRDGDVTSTWNASYTGTDVWPSLDNTTRPAGVGYRRTQYGSAKISLSFEGSGLYLCFTASGATFVVTMDGSVVSQDSSQFGAAQGDVGACAGLGAATMFASPGLDAGPHSMLLTVSAASDNEFRFFGGMLTLGVNTKGHDVKDSDVIDDQDLGWNLSGGRVATGGSWDTNAGATLFDNTGTFQCNYGKGSTASYKFSGAGGLVLYGNVWKDAHSFSVSLDDTTVNMDATSSWEDGRTVLFAQGGLDPAAVHTLTVFDYSSADDGCTNGQGGTFRFCCVGIDSLLLLEPGTNTLIIPSPSSPSGVNTGTPDPQTDTQHSSSSKSVAGPVAGGVIGGLALAAILILALLLYRRKKGREAEIASVPVDSAQFIAHPWDADADYVMRYTTGQGSSTAAVLSSSDAYASPGARPVVREKQPLVRGAPIAGNLAATSSADTRSRTDSTTTSGVGQPMAPVDLERVLAFVAERMDQQRPAAETQQSEERPPQYRG